MTAGMRASQNCRGRARQHHRRHHRHPHGDKEREGAERVATPMSIPLICQTATTQDAAASPSVAVKAVAVAAVLMPIMVAVLPLLPLAVAFPKGGLSGVRHLDPLRV